MKFNKAIFFYLRLFKCMHAISSVLTIIYDRIYNALNVSKKYEISLLPAIYSNI